VVLTAWQPASNSAAQAMEMDLPMNVLQEITCPS
jgi:hypothetical protein